MRSQPTKSNAAIEAMIGSAGILVVGFMTIPLTAWLVGAQVSTSQGVGMSIIFFFGRWVWLYALRRWFATRKKEKVNGR